MGLYDRENPSAAIPQLEKAINTLPKEIIEAIYPVGTYYYTSDAEYDPSIVIGEWEQTATDPYEWHRIR